MSDAASTVLERQASALARTSSGVGRDGKGDRVDRDKILEVTLQQIEKQHGRGAVMKLGEHPMNVEMQTIPTGSLALDIALGIGGGPRGGGVEGFWPGGAGQTNRLADIISRAPPPGGGAAVLPA